MHYPHQFLAVRLASAASMLLMLGGLLGLWTGEWLLPSGGIIAPYLLTIGVFLACASIAGLVTEGIRFAATHAEAVEGAQRLARGETLNADGDNELLELLAAASERFGQLYSAVNGISTGRELTGHKDEEGVDAIGRTIRKFAEVNRRLDSVTSENEELKECFRSLAGQLRAAAQGDLNPMDRSGPSAFKEASAAFVLFTDEVRGVLTRVTDNSEKINTQTVSAIESTEQLARSCSIQTAQTERAIAASARIAARIREIDENSLEAARSGTELMTAARAGSRSAEDTVGAMHFVRRQAQETSKKVKKLGERSQEIAQIVGQIDALSDKTSLLALNATLQASASGAAGSAFIEIADEVERLAERSRKLTAQAALLTQSINAETKEAVACMDDTVREVVVGSALADKVEKELETIETLSRDLTGKLEIFSVCAKEQAVGSDDLSVALSSILEAAAIIKTATKSSSESNRVLLRLSEESCEAITRFYTSEAKVPVRPISDRSEVHVN